MKTGRPTKYKPEYCEAIETFFNVEPWEDVEIEYTNKKGDTWTKTDRRANRIPTFHAFAASIGVNEDTVVEWAKHHDDFSAAYKRAKELQKWFLIENGLNNLYNATFAIFTAKNITDMRDRQEVTGAEGGPVEHRIIYLPQREPMEATSRKTN